jgi:ABC-type sugar transport system substrate-binding protein
MQMFAVGLCCIGLLAGCGDSDDETSSDGGGSGDSAAAFPTGSDGSVEVPELGSPPADARADLEKYVPEDLRPDYDQFWTFADIGPNPYADFNPGKGPHKFCVSETFLKNTYRQNSLEGYKDEIARLADEGVADGELTVTNANGDINVHISQINQLVSQGCDVIFSLTAGPTGICDAVKNAREQDVLFMTVYTPVECPDAINFAINDALIGATEAAQIANIAGGEGKVLMVNGLAGLALSTARNEAAKEVFSQAGMEIAGEVQGDFTGSVAKANALKYLATHPEELAGAWEAGNTATSVAQAFDQVGRPQPAMASSNGECSWLAYTQENDVEPYAQVQDPIAQVKESIAIARRFLDGEKAKTNLFMVRLPQVTPSNFEDFYESSMSVNDTCGLRSPDNEIVPDSPWDAMFE